MNTDTGYAEKSQQMTIASRSQAAVMGGGWLGKAFEKSRDIAAAQIDAINALREAGCYFNIASGREQLLFNADGFKFVRDVIMPHLPASARMEHVEFAVHVARILPGNVASIEELRPYRKEMQMMLGLLNLAESVKRIEPQVAHAKNYFVDVIDKTKNLEMLFKKLTAAEPVTDWPNHKLEEFMRDTKPARDWLEKITRLAEQRGLMP